ncbi:MAG: exostosin domain-containing protein [Nonlabens sp.]|uniref:exostosin domain-containing protein n=1 Tax=Nonlabens sp. TaxID=1888209 RepID=UPI003EF83F4C
MIKLYTYKELLIPENRTAVFPLLFDLYYYENAHPSVTQYYQLVDEPSEAHVFIFPVNYFTIKQKGYLELFKAAYQLAVSQGKKLMVYTGGDYGKTFKDDNIITWRNAGFKSSNHHQTIIIPSFIKDPIERDDVNFNIHLYKTQPQISFTGFATNSWKEKLRILLSTAKGNLKRAQGRNRSDKQSFYNAARKRFTFLNELENNSKINTDFIYREKYRAGAVTFEQREQTTAEFFKNLNDSPYTFCLRGAGNFSVRFYESLALGRIPVLIDTDVVLPLEDLIDWDQHICRVLPHENLEEKLWNFHKSLKPDQFEELQKSNRRLYEDYLVRHAFFCKLHDSLKALL